MERLTNISYNTLAQVQDSIRQRERIHWFLGLREAEEVIRTSTDALEETSYNLRKQDRAMQRLELQLQGLEGETDALTQIKKEELADRLAQARRAKERLQPMFRDTQMALTAAQAEYDRLVAAHPEVTELSYEVLQERYTPVALAEKQAHFLASRVIAALRGLPESVGDLLVGLDPAQCDYVASRALEIKDGVSNQLVMQDLAQLLALMPAADRRLVLEQSIALTQQRKQLEANYGVSEN